MQLQYTGKKSVSEILASIPPISLRKANQSVHDNLLIQGNNVQVLKYLIQQKHLQGCIDLRAPLKTPDAALFLPANILIPLCGTPVLAGQKALPEWFLEMPLIYIDPPFATNHTFTIKDGRASTISSASNGNIAYTDQLKGAAFLEFLRERLILLHMLLSEQGSIYLHIDYKIGHYIKIIMDEIFGIENFKNDIIIHSHYVQ
jgi:adenine-specific DNA-methyltransferase